VNKELKDKIFLITYGIILFILLTNYKIVLDVISKLFSVCYPFFIGMIIAYILNIIVNMLENKPLKKLKKCKRVVSVTLSLLIIVGFVIVLLSTLIPQVQNAGEIFVENLPKYQETMNDLGNKYGLSEEEINVIDLEDNKLGKELVKKIKNNSSSILETGWGFASSIFSGLINAFVGIVFAVYLLMDKEHLIRQVKRVLRKILKEKHYNKLIELCTLSNKTFSDFVKVQTLEACILGILCYIGMIIFRFPYAGTISVVVGFTALVPIFGAFVGLIIGAFLIFMVSPMQALWFVIFFEVLQQLENNLVYPRVVGGKIGLPSIWVLVAVSVGGSLFSVFGMLIGVPIVSVIYNLARNELRKEPTHTT
jgi:predicted PurR-regulated permease PerM